MIELEEGKADQEIVVGPFLDFSDGVTPKTGITKTGGPPGWQNSTIRLWKWSGVVPTLTDITLVGSSEINEITELEDGQYRIKLTAANVDAPGPMRIAFRDEDHYVPIWHDIMVKNDNAYQSLVLGTASLTDITTILSRLGAWAGSGSNTVLGGFKALARNDATLPSDLGGTYSVGAHSQQALRKRQDAIAVGRTLDMILTAVNQLGQRLNISTGPTTTSDLALRTGGYLHRVLRGIRKRVNEAMVLAKYKDSDLLEEMTKAWPQIWSDLRLAADNLPYVDVAIDINTTDTVYQLPAGMGELRRLAKIAEETGLVEWEVYPMSDHNPWGHGVRIEGPTLRLGGKWDTAYSLVLTYVPDGEVAFHEGTGKWKANGDGNVTLFEMDADQPITGRMDLRQNAYAGQILRAFSSPEQTNPEVSEDRLISGSNGKTLTVRPAVVMSAGTVMTYEVAPQYGALLESVLELNVAMRVLTDERSGKAYKMANKRYLEDMRAIRLRFANMQSRRADRHEGDVRENRQFSRTLRGVVG